MSKGNKKIYWASGLLVAILSFILHIVGISVILGSELNMKNFAVFLGFSIAAGLITLLLVRFRFKIALSLFLAGLFIGFFEMYLLFIRDSSGWGDLAGLISLFMWVFIGIGLGVFTELGVYYYRKMIKKNE